MEPNNEKKSGNKMFMILSGVLFLLSGFLGYQLYNQKNATEMVTAEKEKEDVEYAAVKAELSEVQKAYDGLQTDNKQLQSELDGKKEELEDLAAQLEKEKEVITKVKCLQWVCQKLWKYLIFRMYWCVQQHLKHKQKNPNLNDGKM